VSLGRCGRRISGQVGGTSITVQGDARTIFSHLIKETWDSLGASDPTTLNLHWTQNGKVCNYDIESLIKMDFIIYGKLSFIFQAQTMLCGTQTYITHILAVKKQVQCQT
jgi:hypothetical protein